MASIDPALDPDTVARLGTYPWFHGAGVPEYKSGVHGSPTKWKKQYKSTLVSMWTRHVPTDITDIRRAARSAVEFQLNDGWQDVILAAPLTTMDDQTLEPETRWIDAGLQACKELNVTQPVLATIALSEALLHVPPLKNPLAHSFSNITATRTELSGAYIVLEQSDPNNYFWNQKDPLASLLTIIDDLHRGAQKRAIVNYVGTFGLVAKAAGAEAWASGYYLTQRRFSLRRTSGRARPRYHSFALAGDIGLKEDLAAIHRSGLAEELMTPTIADEALRNALKQGKTPDDVPEWRYAQSNCGAAQQHYLELVSEYGKKVTKMPEKGQRDWITQWLETAVNFTETLARKGLAGQSTDTHHQKVWRDVFNGWRNYAKQ
ncbi:MAG: hypothetical protein ACRD4X_02935 [Candidatus Acidiferrales bacterium]